MTAEETLAAAICEALEGGGSTDDALAALTNLQDLVVSERERADRLHDDLRESEDFHAERHEQLRERADQAEQERDAQRTGHGVMFARAVRAETALRGVAVLLRRIPWLPEYAGIVTATVYQSLSLIEDSLGLSDDERGTAPGQYEAALSGLADDTQEQGAWEGYDGGRTCGQEGWHYYEDGLAACRCGLLRGQRDEGTA